MYTVFLYEKDSDTYVDCGSYEVYIDAARAASAYNVLIKKELVRRENGEPFDWVIIKKDGEVVRTYG